MEDYQYDRPPTDKHLIAIGKVVVESALLENIMELAIWKLESLLPKEGFKRTHMKPFRRLSQMFLIAAKREFTSEQDIKDLQHLESDMILAATQRGEIVHGSWGWGIKEDSPILGKFYREGDDFSGRSGVRMASEIELIAGNISQAGDNLIAFLVARGVETPPR